MNPPEDDLTTRFAALFAGNTRVYGTFNNLKEPNSGGKRYGNPQTVFGDPGPLFKEHLTGTNALGIAPITDANTCVFGAIDIDQYADLDHAGEAARFKGLGLPLVACKSKSGGLHAYLFTKSPVTALAMQEKLREIAVAVGHGQAEVFPKQTRLDPEKKSSGASWINLPFLGGDNSTRCAIHPDGHELSLADFLDYAEGLKVDPAFLLEPTPQGKPVKAVKAEKARAVPKAEYEAIPDGPPCLNHLIQVKFPIGTQDKGMLNLGIYAKKAHPDNWPEWLQEQNEAHFVPQIASDDMRRIISSLDKTEYPYSCKTDPLLSRCNSKLCAKRPHGVGDGATDDDAGLVKNIEQSIKQSGHFFARDEGDKLYVFEDSVYRPTGERFVRQAAKQFCEDNRCTKSWHLELGRKVAQYIVEDAPKLLERPSLDTLNVANGLLDVRSRELRPHDPKCLSPVQIAAAFDAKATCPAIDKFVSETFPPDAHSMAWQLAAWLMLPDTSIQKAALLIGEGANGKSVFLNLLQEFIGRVNVVAMSLHRIEADKFSAARLMGKPANICPDLPTGQLSGTSMFKAVTGGDSIAGERKFKDGFDFSPYARLVFSANTYPRSDDASPGFFRRWVVLPFTQVFDETNTQAIPRAQLDAMLSTPAELSGLLNRALDALPQIKTGAFQESDTLRAAAREFRGATDPLAVWLDVNTVDATEGYIEKSRLRNMYWSECRDRGIPMLSDVNFTKRLRSLRPNVKPAQRTINRTQVWCFTGIGLMSNERDPAQGAF